MSFKAPWHLNITLNKSFISFLFESMVPPRTLGDTFFLYMAYDQKSKSQQLIWDIWSQRHRGSNPCAGYFHIWDAFSTEYLECAQGCQILANHAFFTYFDTKPSLHKLQYANKYIKRSTRACWIQLWQGWCPYHVAHWAIDDLVVRFATIFNYCTVCNLL